MEGSPAIALRDLLVVRGTVRAVDGVTLDLAPGRITGLLGPSGSGKTTLMRSVVGTQILTSGQAICLGHPAGSPRNRARIGYMAQTPALYADLTVRENLAYFASVLRLGRESVDAVVASVDLHERADALVSTLSGGEVNRASLAVALLGDPELLVLDEPTVGLDPVLRQSLWTLFRRLADLGRTLLVSSHVMEEATRCDDLVLMRDGRVLFHGTQPDLMARAGVDEVEAAFILLATRSSP